MSITTSRNNVYAVNCVIHYAILHIDSYVPKLRLWLVCDSLRLRSG